MPIYYSELANLEYLLGSLCLAIIYKREKMSVIAKAYQNTHWMGNYILISDSKFANIVGGCEFIIIFTSIKEEVMWWSIQIMTK